MKFKKNDPFTKEMAKKGGKISAEKHPENLNRKVGGTFPPEYHTKEHCSNAGKHSRIRENAKAKELIPNYDNMFLPNEVCDRICIKDGKVIFLEIKKNGYGLRTKQKEFKEICDTNGYKYQVEYAK